MNQPNLFSYATSELSQDAFICWLLAWASPKFKNSDKDLHRCSLNLVKALFEKHNVSMPLNIEQVEVRKQDKNIDVLCIINNTYPILIEDKTGTKNHSNQLVRYLNVVRNMGFDEKNIIPIYFKTEDQACYSNVVKNGYQPFLRTEILNVLNTYKGANSILLDYRSHLQSISDKVESYKFKEVSEWGWYAWMGFYIELQKQLDNGHWDYVANPAGGFLGFWWYFQGDTDCEQYLQLEKDKFCFKIRVKNSNERARLRSKWYKNIEKHGSKYGLDLTKPARFGNGKHMTVCVLEGDYRKTKKGMLNVQETIKQLRNAERLLQSIN